MQVPDNRAGYLATARTKPRLIDEWQDAPVLWDAVRMAVDGRGLKGQFILTGSTVIEERKNRNEELRRMHTGTGRISTMTMFPMSLYESGESNGEVLLKALFDNPDTDIDGAVSQLRVEEIIFAACRSGWPESLDVKRDNAKLIIAGDYLNVVCDEDISRIDDIRRGIRLSVRQPLYVAVKSGVL